MQTKWWRDAVIYEIYIRSFADGGGDGVGDIAGIRARLPYLRDLGVDAIWITPWYRSPMADGGYDVADYRDIDPLFGTLADAEDLIRETHEHGMRLLVDIVPNHTSDRHAWFRAALATEPGSPARARYHFRDGRGPDQPPNNWRSVFGGPAWSRVPDGQWYLHLFAPQQPDLNWARPDVCAEFADILRFWLDRGVDGFRIDVANGLAKHPDLPDVADPADHPYWDRDEVHDIYRSWRRLADTYGGDRIFVAEAWVDDADRLARYVRPDELHTAFNFNFLRCPWDAGSFRSVVDESLRSAHAVGAPATWVLSNHDVTRHVTRYGRARTSGVEPINAPRVPSDIETGTRRARAALLLMLALPGSAYLYQGEELGLAEVEDLPDDALRDPTWTSSGHTIRGRDGCRVPLPWRGQRPPFGFGPDGSRPWLPQPAGWSVYTAEHEQTDPESMLRLYQAALRLRREHPGLGDGALSWAGSPDGVLILHREPGLLCAVNLSDAPCPLPDHDRVLLASEPIPNGKLPTDAAAWLQVS